VPSVVIARRFDLMSQPISSGPSAPSDLRRRTTSSLRSSARARPGRPAAIAQGSLAPLRRAIGRSRLTARVATSITRKSSPSNSNTERCPKSQEIPHASSRSSPAAAAIFSLHAGLSAVRSSPR
jgi:hypothetical protein